MKAVLVLLAGLFVLSLLTLPLGIYGTLATAVVFVMIPRRDSGPRLVDTSSPNTGALPIVAVTGVVLLALFARWPVAAHDVEHYIGPDEGEVVENVLEMIKTGDFDHRHPGYPGLHFYLQMIPARARLAATHQTIPELPRSVFYLTARRVTLLAGLAAALAVYWVGRAWLSRWSAALAASLLALSPLAFRESAVVNPDLMLMLFVVVSVGCSLRLVEKPTRSGFVVAGISVGLASAIKYTGGFVLAPYLVAWWLGAERRAHVGRALVGVVAAGIAFIAASPYTVLNLPSFYRGLEMHAGYYRAASQNAPFTLSRQIAARGVGVPSALLAVLATIRGLVIGDKRVLVVLAYPVTYFIVFSFFDRAFPRHALPLLPFAALLAADVIERTTHRRPKLGWALAAILLAAPAYGTIDLALRSRRSTPADNAARWAVDRLPAGSRVLQDQFTPSLKPPQFRSHRLRVDEKRFLGNFDYVVHSGYPPGLETDGMREVARFENQDALGSLVVVYQVPERESLMPLSVPDVRIGAGEAPFFGDGWYAPDAGAYRTSRLSEGDRSEIFFKLADTAPQELTAELTLSSVVNDTTRVTAFLNGHELESFVVGATMDGYSLGLPSAIVSRGLNRLELAYENLTRLNRRRRDTAIRLYGVELKRR